jgi:hypothetical protein
MSFASRVWRAQAKEFLRAYIGHFRKTGLFDRVIAHQVGAGHTGEWVKGESSMYGPCKEPRFESLLREFRETGDMSMTLDRSSASEIAVLLDDESFFYESCRYNLDIPLIFQQRLWGLPRLGAPFDVFLLDDFLAGRLRPYKLYIFLNPLCLNDKRRKALSKELRREGRTALWIYAPGYLKDDPGLENMEELTGIRFGLGEQPWGPLVHITDFEHPLTKGLDQDLFWGTNNKLAPLFYVDDPEARVLGQVVYSQGNCRPGFAVKEFPAWRSVYSAAPNLPASLLRAIARWAGVHIWNDAGDVLYADSSLLGVHSLAGGRRVFRLPRRAPAVTDIFANRTVARGATEFEVVLEPKSTVLYSIGGESVSGSR